MSNYTKSTDFEAKDALPSGDSDKIIRGAEFEVEFDNIAVAVNSKANSSSPVFTSPITIDGVGLTASASELNILDGVTASTAELNILDGVTSTAEELNLVDGSIAGTIVNSKGVVYGAAGEVNATTLQIAGTSITSTAAELNILDGVTSTAAELNILDGVTSTAAEINLLDGVTATTAELNILDGVTATAAELNILDGVTSFLDEDTMSSDSATSIASQQSIKAYVDSQVSGGAGLSVDATVRTGAFTAVAGNIYQCNMTSAFTATLPLSPSAGDEVGFAFVADSNPASNNLTLGRNSEDIENEAADFIWDINSPRYFSVIYISALEGWKVKL
tara:strand:- start:830 stop:1828 length:999 start_codon:yes stop_codon:yes gene_type:complete